VAGDILIYVEHEAGRPKRTALEAASQAARMTAEHGGKVLAVALGAGATSTAGQLGKYGVEELYASDDAVFDDYLSAPHADALSNLLEQTRPTSVLFPDTLDGRDIAARVAARHDCGLVSSVVELTPHNQHLDGVETIFGGNYLTTVEVRNSPFSIFLVRPNAFTPEETPRSATLHTIDYRSDEGVARARKGASTAEEGAPTPLEEASIIVSGGRGVGGPEPFETILKQLADSLGGVVGASRAAVDAGWVAYSHQVGQTGRTVKPQLYMAIGISGAVQHRVGMQTADTIVAINRDPDAPIFALADLGVVGDLFKIVPALTDEIKRRKGA